MKAKTKGVESYNNKWRARIWDGTKNVNLGTFKSKADAIKAYKTAKINQIKES